MNFIILLIILSILYCLKKYFNGNYNLLKKDLKGKIILVTGANTGIGFESAKELAKMGAKVILACRNLEKGKEALKKINDIAQVQSELLHIDLSNMHSIRSFVNEFKRKYDRLDILINNGGLLNPVGDRSYTQDGFEMHFGTNYLGHFLLTNLLLDILQNTPQFRVINVSSSLFRKGKLDFSDLNYEKRLYSGVAAYQQSKLAINLSTIKLQKLFDSKKINGKTVYLHPGVVRTDGQRYLKEGKICLLFWMAYPFWWFLTKDQNLGAQTIIYCAIEDFNRIQGGGYYKECNIAIPKHQQLTDEYANELWEKSCQLVKL